MSNKYLTKQDFFINGKYDLEKLKIHFLHGGAIESQTLHSIISNSMSIFQLERNIIEIDDTALIFGDLHGNYFNLLQILDDPQWNEIEHTKIFLGDYVDRGQFSTECMITLLCMKLNNPNGIYLLRGNHESLSMTHAFGFEKECLWKYDKQMYIHFIRLFQTLPICGVLRREVGNFFLCHGGISPLLNSLRDIDRINRFQEPGDFGVFRDLLWADPLQYEVYEEKYDEGEVDDDWFDVDFLDNTVRNCSFFFGYKSVLRFLQNNNLRAIIRAHECVDGISLYDYEHEDGSPLVFTAFSSAGYNEDNRGGALCVTNSGMKVQLYEYEECQFDLPLYTNVFKFSFPRLFDELQSICDELMILSFNVFEDDYEEDIRDERAFLKFGESDSSDEENETDSDEYSLNVNDDLIVTQMSIYQDDETSDSYLDYDSSTYDDSPMIAQQFQNKFQQNVIKKQPFVSTSNMNSTTTSNFTPVNRSCFNPVTNVSNMNNNSIVSTKPLQQSNVSDDSDSEDDFTKRLELLEKQQQTLKTQTKEHLINGKRMSPNLTIKTDISKEDESLFKLNDKYLEEIGRPISVPNTPNSKQRENNEKLFLSLTSIEKKKGFFAFQFMKRTDSVPLSLSALRKKWNSLIKKEQKEQKEFCHIIYRDSKN